ncbi:MAG: SusC/RagA family TonB-linked outer membrane protein [Paludibacter sp.]|nr:SusC/RagA family TonB-linked outer membrane protein [Paludibacter sp.]
MKNELFIKGESIPLLFNHKWRLFPISLLLLCLFFYSPVKSYASTEKSNTKEALLQSKSGKIVGEIKDDSGELLLGVSVLIKGTTIGTITNAQGRYVLNNVPQGRYVVEASYIGHDKQSINVSLEDIEERVVNITLRPSLLQLDEVTVTALGIKKSDKAIGYAISKLSSEDLNNTVSSNWMSGLSGKVAGLNFDQSSAGPGGSMRVTLRGEGSLSHDKNTALFVIDGVPLNSDITPSNSGGGYANADAPIDYGGGAGDLNPEDIESVSVLKGPSATALYGSRAANGAIIITTRSGSKSKGLGVTVNTSMTLEQAGFWPDFQNEYGAGNYSKNNRTDVMPREFSWWTVDGTSRFWSRYNFGEKFEGQQRYMYASKNWETNEFNRLPYEPMDWYKGFFETGVTYNNSVSIDSNTGKGGSFRFSLRDTRNDWIVPNTGYNSQNINFSATQEINKVISMSTRMTYYRKNSDNLPMSGYSTSSPLYTLIWAPAAVDVKDFQDEYFTGRLIDIHQQNLGTSNLINYDSDNPYFQVYEQLNTMTRDRVFGNASINITLIPKKLNLIARTGMDWSGEFRTQRKPYYSVSNRTGMYREQNVNSFEMNNDFLLSYKDKFGDFGVNASFGGNNMVNQYRSVSQTAPKLFTYNVYQLQNSDGQIISSNFRKSKSINSFFGFVSADWKGIIFAEITGRNDWSSTLAPGYNSYFYPSVNTSFLLDQAFNFKDNAPWVDLMKLRASWANVGNDTDPYQLEQVYNNSDFTSAYQLSGRIQNKFLKPENIESWELGIDTRLFRNRLSFDVTYYDAATTNQIINVPTSWDTGASSQVINAGKVTNKGIEISTRFQPVKTKNLSWYMNLNWSKNWNKLVELAPGVELWQLNTSNTVGSRVFVYAFPGTELGRIYGAGYVRAPEGSYYMDGDEKISCAGQVIVDGTTGNPILGEDLLDFGSIYPDWKAGMTQTLSYKNFTLNMTFSGQYGGKAYSVTNFALSYMGKLTNTLEGRYDGLIHEGVNLNPDGTFSENTKITTDIVDYYNTVVWNRNNVEQNTFSTSYLKMKECRLDYKLSSKVLKQIGFLQSAFLGVYATNLFSITDWPQYDPEVASFGGGSLNRGVETGGYPMTRTYGFNLRVSF